MPSSTAEPARTAARRRASRRAPRRRCRRRWRAGQAGRGPARGTCSGGCRRQRRASARFGSASRATPKSPTLTRPAAVEQDVRRLDVAVHDPLGVRAGERVTQLLGDARAPPRRRADPGAGAPRGSPRRPARRRSRARSRCGQVVDLTIPGSLTRASSWASLLERSIEAPSSAHHGLITLTATGRAGAGRSPR